MNLNVPINDDDRAERAEELKEASGYSKNTEFGRALIDAAYEAYEQSGASDPMEAVRTGGSASESAEIDYEPDERRREPLDAAEIRAIVRGEREPVINPLHVPGDAAEELSTLKEREKLCMAVARHEHDYLSRDEAEEIVEDVIGRGSNDYYVDPDRADVPGKMIDACYEEPNIPSIDQDDLGRFVSAEAYISTWVGLVNTAIDEVEASGLSDGQLGRTLERGEALLDHGDELLLALDDEGRMDMVEELLDRLQEWGGEMGEAAIERGVI